MYHILKSPHTQRGAALIVALSILLILTILGVSAMSTTALQERMAGNARDADVAFEAAETALRKGEYDIDHLASPTAGFSSAGTGGLFLAGATEAWRDTTNWDISSGKYATATYSLTTNSPQYMIQLVNANVTSSPATSLEPISYSNNLPVVAPSVQVYQITARGYGLSANSRVMLQSHYAR